MATLTESAFYTRKYIRWGIIGIILFTILRMLFGLFLNYLRQAFPPVIKPNNAFGRLPTINFPKTASISAQLEFSLQTIQGTLPEVAKTANVYFMPKARANLLSLSRAQSLVGKVGFTTTPRQIATTVYRWVDLKNALRTMEMDIVSNQFTLNYLYAHDLPLFNEKNIPSPNEAGNETVSFLQSLNLNTPDIDTKQPKVGYLKLVGNQLFPTTSQSQADAAKVDYFRKNYDGLKMLTDKNNEGNISFILGGSKRSDQRLLYVKYQYWPIEAQTVAIYKLKTSQQAWEELVAGKAYLANIPDPNLTKIAITNVSLAYYDGSQAQLFMQPIIVFEGEGGFAAYVSAVAPPWIE